MKHVRYFPGWTIVAMIIFLFTLGPLSTDMYLPGLPEIVNYFGTTEAILNISLYGFLFAQAVSILLIGPISDKYGRKRILIGSIVVYSVSSVLCGFAPSISLFIIMRIFQGLAVGGLLVISTALIKDCFEDKSRGKILTIVTVLSVIGPMTAPILGAFLIQYVNWQSTLIFPGIIVLFLLIIAVSMGESLKESEKIKGTVASALSHLPKLCKNKKFTCFLISMGIWTLPFFAFLAVSSYIFEGTFGLSETQYSIFLAIDVIVATIIMIIITKVTSKGKMATRGKIIILCGIVSSILILTVGSFGPIIFLLSFIPVAVATVSARPYCLDILLRQYDGDTGSISSLYNFSVTFLGCIGMILVTLPWSSFIFGLGICIVIGTAISLLFWLLTNKGGCGLKGLE